MMIGQVVLKIELEACYESQKYNFELIHSGFKVFNHFYVERERTHMTLTIISCPSWGSFKLSQNLKISHVSISI